jgi:hypothetical protein
MFEQVRELMDSYHKPIVIASDMPFGNGEMERQMSAMLGEREMICYPLPDHAAIAFASLARYAQYLRESGDA